jgi:hypothetical protein
MLMSIPSLQALLDVAMDHAIDRALKKMLSTRTLVCEKCLYAALARTLAADVFPLLKDEYRRPRSEQKLTLDFVNRLIDEAADSALSDAAKRCEQHTL